MAHVKLPDGAPGIIGPLIAYPGTRVHLSGLAEALRMGPSSLTPGDRGTIAAYVSAGSECRSCGESHAAAARAHLGEHRHRVDRVIARADDAPASPKLKAILAIAEKVRRDGRLVQAADVERARAAGADDKAIHATALIAAAFCMFNRSCGRARDLGAGRPGRLHRIRGAAGRAGLCEFRPEQRVS